jgi:hypothetical protein
MKMPKPTSQAEDYSRPWAIIRLLPDARRVYSGEILQPAKMQKITDVFSTASCLLLN